MKNIVFCALMSTILTACGGGGVSRTPLVTNDQLARAERLAAEEAAIKAESAAERAEAAAVRADAVANRVATAGLPPAPREVWAAAPAAQTMDYGIVQGPDGVPYYDERVFCRQRPKRCRR